jgi:resuscitation-promoting factor RpfB
MFPRSPRSRPLRRARSVTSLGMVGLLALPLIAWSNRVDVVVDGELHGLRTYASTVGDVLDQLEVEVGPADEVTPGPATEVSDGLTIGVARAITVDVYVDGRFARQVTAPVRSVAGVLEEADLGDVREQGADIAPRWTAPVEDGDSVHVTLPQVVSLTVDGETREVETLVSTVESLLHEVGVELGADDVVRPIPGAALEAGAEVVVQRVAEDEIVEEVSLPREEVRRETDDLRKGTTKVEDEGRDGVRHDTYRVTTVDGEETERELISREVAEEPRPRIVLVGTFVPPPPPPPPPPRPAPAPSPTATASAPKPAPATSTSDVWDRLARCESGGNWSLNTGNGYHGGLQFHPDTWNRHKPSGYPTYAYQATREQQIVVGERVQRSQGWGAWPHCSRQLGLR